MADNNSSASDSDNAALTVPNNLRISCNAATQTPEMPRHAIMPLDSDTTSTLQAPTPSSFVVLRVDNPKDLSDFEKEAKALAIPDVVVEYIKDSCALTGRNGDELDRELGASNLGFECSESISRAPSKTSLRDDLKSGPPSHLGSSTLLNAKYYDDNSGSDVGLLPIGGPNHRMYHSMPRNMAKKYLLGDFRIHSQPASPRLQRTKTSEHLEDCNSNFSLYPAPNGIGFVAPPSPNFGYRPLESETSAVYTIIKTCMNTNDMRGIHFLPSKSDSIKSTPGLKRKFEFVPTPPAFERRRRRLQFVTDACSLMFFLPGLLLAILTPIFIIPMFLYPISYFIYLAAIFVASGAVSACILFFSGFLGNLVWYYDDKSKRLRLKLHCGTGPMRHFWGNSFFYWSDKAREKKKKMEMII